MQKFLSRCGRATNVAVFAVVFFSSAPPAYSADAGAAGKSPAPIIVIAGPNGLTITSAYTQALDEFERLLRAAADGLDNGPMAVFYVKYAKAPAVAEELEKILSGGAPDPGKPAEKSSDAVRRGPLATGPIKITPDTRLNALFVLANRADQKTVERLLKILDLKESPEEIALAPKPRMILVKYTRVKDVAEVLRQVYADRVVVEQAQGQQRRGRGIATLMRGMMGGGRGQGQDQSDPATRISIGADTRTNTLVVVAVDPLFEEVKDLVHQLDATYAAENETVQVVTLHRASAPAVEKALEAFAGDAVQANSSVASLAASGGVNATRPSPAWASQGYGRTPGGQRNMGNNRFFGGGSSPFQGFGGQRGSPYSQPGRARQ